MKGRIVNLRSLAALAAAVLLLAGCHGFDIPNEVRINGIARSFTVSSAGYTVSVNIQANFDYQVVIPPDAGKWVSVESQTLEQLKLKVAENTEYSERSTPVFLSDGANYLDTLSIEQAGVTPRLEHKAPVNEMKVRLSYFPSYRDVGPTGFPTEYMKTINVAAYAFATLNEDFSITFEQPEKVRTLVERCHANGVKVVLSFSGKSAYYKKMVKSGRERTNFVNAIMNFVKSFNLDGVDNDWEYPSSSDDSGQNNLYLMRQFSNILHAPGENKLLTMAICTGEYDSTRNGIDKGVFDCCDWFCVMCYNSVTSSTKPETYDASAIFPVAADKWINVAGMPKYKFVPGFPLYSTSSTVSNQYGYKTLLSKGADPDKDMFYMQNDAGTWFYSYYNGRPTVRKKVNMVKDNGWGGYFFWETSYDTFDNPETSLMLTAYREFMKN